MTPLESEAESEMSRLGITRVPMDYFHVGEFRYTSLADAVAEARRRHHPATSL
ncbi:MAG: hypothetical protein RLO51_13290 [Thalassobaculum sp.]|uniref:hypothetical protein n=1 Tax=Thalassobaculum sp. TaxID=2022740 RepID=UPI0032ED186C